MNKENEETQNNITEKEPSSNGKSNNKTSFENYLKHKNPNASSNGVMTTSASPSHEKKIKFIDEVDNKKPFEDVVNVESYKMYNVDISEEVTEQNCNCVIF